MNESPAFYVWQAWPAPSGIGWMPWELMQTPPQTTAAEAHTVARSVRKVCPDWLVAVRPADAGLPLTADGMRDAWDVEAAALQQTNQYDRDCF